MIQTTLRGSPGARHCAAASAGAAGCCWPIAWAAPPWQPRRSRPKPRPRSKAKSVIQIFLWGGMSHIDTWDPKPEAGREYMGEFAKAIPTNVDGIQIGELFPEAGEAGRQVFAHPQHDPPQQRP